MAAQQVVTTTQQVKSRFSLKTLLGVIGILILTGGVITGTYLVQREQDLRSKAAAVIDQGSVNNLNNCSSLEIHPQAKSSCGSFCSGSGCKLPSSIPQGVCEIRRFHSTDAADPVVNDNQTGFTNSAGGELGFNQSCGAEQIDVGCYTDNLNHDGNYNDGFKSVAWAWRRYSESCDGTPIASAPPPTDGGGDGGGGIEAGKCGASCYTQEDCTKLNGNYKCFGNGEPGSNIAGVCRNSGCSSETDCDCSTPTQKPTPKPTTQPTVAPSPTPLPDIAGQCLNIKVFDTDWNLISISDVKPGDTVRFTVEGSVSLGQINKARFFVDGTQSPEVTSYRPGSAEFYYEYAIPADATGLTVRAEVHHETLGWF